jgi:N-acetylmuramoyl-L-alanine amidase
VEIKSRWILFSGLICLLLFVGATTPKPKAVGIRKVVIDAGHGGHDPGTVGKHTKEKDVALSVALRLGRYIQENFPEVEVVYTRKTDVFVELYRRAQIANESKANLFISIHCNGTKSSQAKGTETWVMGLHKSKENLEVAKTENATILMEDNLAKYDGFDPNSPEANIIFSLFQNVYLDKSLDIAAKVQKYFRVRMNTTDRGVKQAGFWVLYKTTMPGILIETGFLSNPDDEQLLSSEHGQDQIAASIFNAFREYKEEAEGLAFTGNKAPKEPVSMPKEPEKKEIVNKDPEPEVVERKEPPLKIVESPKNQDDAFVFKVQIASSDKLLKEENPIFKGVRGVASYKHKGMIKYVVGDASSLKEALDLQKKMAAKGFKDAFVVVFQNGERVSEDIAKKLIPKM